MNWKQTLEWLMNNDDCEWIEDENPIPAVTFILACDIFNKDVDKAVAQFKKMVVNV
jgi:hypothetical protein